MLLEAKNLLPAAPRLARRAAYENALSLSRRKSHDALLTTQLGAIATLLFSGVPHSIALFTMGQSASAKSEQLRAFDQPHRLLERVDEFTVAGLRPSAHSDPKSGAKSRSDKAALYEILKNRVMLTSELSGIFRGHPHGLQTRFSTIAKWLDGDGYIINTGTFGKQGKAGDFFCIWLGCTTGFKLITWQTMSELGTRLLFFPMEELPKDDEVPDGQMREAADDARKGVKGMLDCLLEQHDVRSLGESEQPTIPKNVYDEIDDLTTLLALGNTMQGIDDPTFISRPKAMHYRSRLREIVRGIVWITGRTEASMSDIQDYVRPIVRCSMPQSRGPVLLALRAGCVKVADIIAHIRDFQHLRLDPSVIARTLGTLKELSVVQCVADTSLRVTGRPSASWFLNSEALS